MQRRNLADEIALELRRRIVDGGLVPGQRINEVELAGRLEVSRTPLREALAQLATEGFVESRPRRGYFVQRAGAEEAEALYGIRAILDPAALELAGLPDAGKLDRLAALNERLAATTDVESAMSVDDEWHMALLAHCPNPVLLDLIRLFMDRTRPLEREYLKDRGNVARATGEHARILAALRGSDLSGAVERLRANMRAGTATIVEWAAARSAGAGERKGE